MDEQSVQQIGRRILDEARLHREHSWFSNLLNHLMADERLRSRMLRFVDVLPALQIDQEIARHLDEYLGDLPLPLGDLPIIGAFPGAARWMLHHTRKGMATHVVAAGVRSVANRMAARFIAGHDTVSVARALKRLHDQGKGFTLDLLGEATVSDAEADAYEIRYLRLLDELVPLISPWSDNPNVELVRGRRVPRLSLSVKVSALAPQLDPADPSGSAELIKQRLRQILHKARARGASITLDMEQYDTKEITLRAFRELLVEPELRDWPDVGIAMQAYLRDTPEDLEALIAWAKKRGTPVLVRLVRGAYWDYETVIARQNGWMVPVWTHKHETDACYERCTRMLLENHPHVEAAIATHNVRSMAVAIAVAREHGLSPQQYEFQMLYGMADPLKDILVHLGQRLRVYVPFGELLPGMAYLVRRLLENTSSQSFLRLGMVSDESADVILCPPLPLGEGRGEGSSSNLAVPNAHETKSQQIPTFRNEPVHRFTTTQERDTFTAAIAHVRTQLGKKYPLVITGEHIAGETTSDSINPARPSEIIGVVASATPAQAADAVTAAVNASHAWAARPAQDRATILRRAAFVMRHRRDELAAWEIFEAGKPWREADADVAEATDFLEYYANEAERLGRVRKMNVLPGAGGGGGETNDYFYEPRGVGAVIAPWNFPLAIITGMASAAVVTGNAIVIKPAPQSPVIASKLMDAFEEAGLPPGVMNFLPGPDEVGEALVRDPRIHFVAFTGSEAVGKRINLVGAEVAAGQDHLKRIIAEMGGKNAIIVDSDADLDDAVRGTVASAFGYAGQKCSAASRVIVVGEIHDAFVRRLIEASQSIIVGPPDNPGTVVGPVIDAAAHERIRRAIDEAKRTATLALEVDVSHLAPGYFIGPVIFTGVTQDSVLAQEEIFGPVLSVLKARDFEDALRIANATRFALTGGVYSRSPNHLAAARRAFRVGNLYLNRKITGALVGRQPFGGFKMSGVGSKAGGPDYLLQFVEPRCVTENTIRRGFAHEEE